jgi:hypothetical protein
VDGDQLSYRETHLTSMITICCVLCNILLLLTLVTTSSSSSNGSAPLWQVQISSKTLLCCEVLWIFKEPYISGPLTVPESKNGQFWLFQGLDHSNNHIIPPEDVGSSWKSFHCSLVSLPYLTQSNKFLLLSEMMGADSRDREFVQLLLN